MMLRPLSATISAFAIALTTLPAAESSKKEARVTQVIREVNLLAPDAPARRAVLNENVGETTAVKTGGESRAELTFVDLTITRLGANTLYRFKKSGRQVELESGSILLRVPKDSGGATILTSSVTAGSTGTTFIFESTRNGGARLTVLEGSRSEEHTSELQSQSNLVCRLLLENKIHHVQHVCERSLD